MEIRKLHPYFGAELRGIDLRDGFGVAEAEAIKAALAEHLLLLVRMDGKMPPERQVEFASLFGGRVSHNSGRPWSVLKNDEAAGEAQLKFHSDFTYTESPIKLICLHAIELPRNGTTTSFVSGVHGWACLPGTLQDQLAGMTVQHIQDFSVTSLDLPKFVAEQPVRFEHQGVGKPVLLVTEYHAKRINELAPEESAAMLELLFAHLYAPENIYTHHWQMHDLLVWDNLAIQHARKDRADPKAGPRALQRVVLNDLDYPELIATARRREMAERAA